MNVNEFIKDLYQRFLIANMESYQPLLNEWNKLNEVNEKAGYVITSTIRQIFKFITPKEIKPYVSPLLDPIPDYDYYNDNKVNTQLWNNNLSTELAHLQVKKEDYPLLFTNMGWINYNKIKEIGEMLGTIEKENKLKEKERSKANKLAQQEISNLNRINNKLEKQLNENKEIITRNVAEQSIVKTLIKDDDLTYEQLAKGITDYAGVLNSFFNGSNLFFANKVILSLHDILGLFTNVYTKQEFYQFNPYNLNWKELNSVEFNQLYVQNLKALSDNYEILLNEAAEDISVDKLLGNYNENDDIVKNTQEIYQKLKENEERIEELGDKGNVVINNFNFGLDKNFKAKANSKIWRTLGDGFDRDVPVACSISKNQLDITNIKLNNGMINVEAMKQDNNDKELLEYFTGGELSKTYDFVSKYYVSNNDLNKRINIIKPPFWKQAYNLNFGSKDNLYDESNKLMRLLHDIFETDRAVNEFLIWLGRAFLESIKPNRQALILYKVPSSGISSIIRYIQKLVLKATDISDVVMVTRIRGEFSIIGNNILSINIGNNFSFKNISGKNESTVSNTVKTMITKYSKRHPMEFNLYTLTHKINHPDQFGSVVISAGGLLIPDMEVLKASVVCGSFKKFRNDNHTLLDEIDPFVIFINAISRAGDELLIEHDFKTAQEEDEALSKNFIENASPLAKLFLSIFKVNSNNESKSINLGFVYKIINDYNRNYRINTDLAITHNNIKNLVNSNILDNSVTLKRRKNENGENYYVINNIDFINDEDRDEYNEYIKYENEQEVKEDERLL